MTKLTSKEHACLAFLDDKLEAFADQIGVALQGSTINNRSRSGSGSNVANALVRRGLVSRQLFKCELYVYRITSAGREALRG